MAKLSTVFSRLSTPAVASNEQESARAGRRVVSAANQKNARQDRLGASRGQQRQQPAEKGNKTKLNVGGRVVKNLNSRKNKNPKAQEKSGPSNGGNKNNNSSNGKGKGRKGKNTREQKPAVDQSTLDKEMDSYWFKAGKGPDPMQVQLDNEIDNYQKQKGNKQQEEAAATVPGTN